MVYRKHVGKEDEENFFPQYVFVSYYLRVNLTEIWYKDRF